MDLITLTLWIWTGAELQKIIEPASVRDCEIVAAQVDVVRNHGLAMERSEGLIVRVQCGRHDMVLELPPSARECEVM
jgi:hypothetical protein